jgi:hypothetical protein
LEISGDVFFIRIKRVTGKIKRVSSDCIMPREEIFALVIEKGTQNTYWQETM